MCVMILSIVSWICYSHLEYNMSKTNFWFLVVPISHEVRNLLFLWMSLLSKWEVLMGKWEVLASGC